MGKYTKKRNCLKNKSMKKMKKGGDGENEFRPAQPLSEEKKTSSGFFSWFKLPFSSNNSAPTTAPAPAHAKNSEIPTTTGGRRRKSKSKK